MCSVDDAEENCSLQPLLETSGHPTPKRRKTGATRVVLAVMIISALNLGLLAFNLSINFTSVRTNQLVSYCRFKPQALS